MSDAATEPKPPTPAAPQSDSEILAEIRDLLVEILAALVGRGEPR